MIANRRNLIKRFLLGGAGVVAFRDLLGPAVFASATPLKLAADPRRPQYHLLPPANWMNDPNGPIYWDGQYHMFYQFNPNAAVWGDMHWGHAVSPDMVRWQHLPVALSPTPDGPDADGCFSGTAVVHGGRVEVLYTGVRSVPESQATLRDGVNSLRETQCLAYSNDSDLKSWTKLPRPVIATPPEALSVTGFRDPTPWRDGDDWLLAVGSGFPNKGGAVLLYRSKDLRNWEYLHPLVSSATPAGGTANPVDSGDMWECPDFFPLGNKHVLIYSTIGKSRWMTGTFDRQALKFNPEESGLLDTGAYYAAKTQIDKAGNRVLWGWIPETRPVEAYRAAGWACLMSLPRILTLGSDGRLRMNTAPEVHQLRRAEQKLILQGTEVQKLLQIAQVKIEAACGEIAFAVRPGSQAFGLSVDADGQEATNPRSCLSLSFDPAHPDQISIDDKSLSLESGRMPAEVNLHIDSSVIELILNSRVAHTKRFYLPGTRPPRLHLNWAGSIFAMERLSVWQLTPISRNRLTT